MSRTNPDKLHTAGLPHSCGKKRKDEDKYKPYDRHGRTKSVRKSNGKHR